MADQTENNDHADLNDVVPVTPHYDLIEFLFYAYRDFTSDPDVYLDAYEFGRAHHRVLHFVNRNPGMMVTDLLAILRITKQSLGRVLKQLVDKGFIEQRPGPLDRRQRLLYTTETGQALADALTAPQSVRLERALKSLPQGGDEIVRQFLYCLINEDVRDDVAKMIYKSDRYSRPGQSTPAHMPKATPEEDETNPGEQRPSVYSSEPSKT